VPSGLSTAGEQEEEEKVSALSFPGGRSARPFTPSRLKSMPHRKFARLSREFAGVARWGPACSNGGLRAFRLSKLAVHCLYLLAISIVVYAAFNLASRRLFNSPACNARLPLGARVCIKVSSFFRICRPFGRRQRPHSQTSVLAPSCTVLRPRRRHAW